MRNARLDLAKFCRAASGQNLAKSSRAFLPRTQLSFLKTLKTLKTLKSLKNKWGGPSHLIFKDFKGFKSLWKTLKALNN